MASAGWRLGLISTPDLASFLLHEDNLSKIFHSMVLIQEKKQTCFLMKQSNVNHREESEFLKRKIHLC